MSNFPSFLTFHIRLPRTELFRSLEILATADSDIEAWGNIYHFDPFCGSLLMILFAKEPTRTAMEVRSEQPAAT